MTLSTQRHDRAGALDEGIPRRRCASSKPALDAEQEGEKINMLTAYDAYLRPGSLPGQGGSAAGGRLLGMVCRATTAPCPVSLADMAYHTAAVKRGNQGALILADLPFMAYATLEQTFASCAALMQAGAHMIKLEGAAWLSRSVSWPSAACRYAPTWALTPQAVNVFGGYKVQGRGDAAAPAARADMALEQAGAPVLLECVPSGLAAGNPGGEDPDYIHRRRL